MALVVARPGVTEDAIRDHLGARLAGFKVPRRYEFRDTLPRDDVGKILKRRLKDEILARATAP